jgi:cell shape-determining protein MreC
MSSFKPYKKRKNILPIIGFVLVGIVAVWLVARAVVSPHKDSLPLASAVTVYNTLLPKKVLVSKITELQTTLESYDAQLTTAKLLAEENDALKAELGRTASSKGTLAHVVTVPNRSLYDTFVIDGGEDVGIAIGQTVYAFDSIALGTISAVADTHATVSLFSTSGRETPGSVGGNNVSVALIGRGGGEYEVRLPRDLQFTTGELIAYQSTHTAVLAEIERIATDPRDPFQRLIVKVPINLQALKWVLVK